MVRMRVVLLIILFCLFFQFGNTAFPNDLENGRPNIIFLVADDLGWNDVGYHGSNIKTPNIDELGNSGAVFNQFYVMPACTPTRASLLTGRYTIRYGLQVGVIKPFHRYGLPVDEKTVYELFNLRTDPYEENNLFKDNPERFKELRERLDFYTEEAVEPLFTKISKNRTDIPQVWEPYWWEN